jgi:hypothetical protein
MAAMDDLALDPHGRQRGLWLLDLVPGQALVDLDSQATAQRRASDAESVNVRSCRKLDWTWKALASIGERGPSPAECR